MTAPTPVTPARTQAQSAAWPGQEAVVATMMASPELRAVLAPHSGDQTQAAVYNTVAPAGAMLPYIVLGTVTEAAKSTFGRRGSALSGTWHLYSGVPGDQELLAIHAALVALFSGTRFPVPGHRLLAVGLTLAATYQDADGTMHGLERVDMTTKRADAP